MEIKFHYGQKILFPTIVKQFRIIPKVGITSLNDKIDTEFTIEKYFDDDVDANIYKIKLVPVDQSGIYSIEQIYAFDLKMMINEGTAKLI